MTIGRRLKLELAGRSRAGLSWRTAVSESYTTEGVKVHPLGGIPGLQQSSRSDEDGDLTPDTNVERLQALCILLRNGRTVKSINPRGGRGRSSHRSGGPALSRGTEGLLAAFSGARGQRGVPCAGVHRPPVHESVCRLGLSVPEGSRGVSMELHLGFVLGGKLANDSVPRSCRLSGPAALSSCDNGVAPAKPIE
jgi:hypothetical protein